MNHQPQDNQVGFSSAHEFLQKQGFPLECRDHCEQHGILMP
ncbi:hypothetical protein BH695_4470 [Microcystis aeruginosa PCC 7806SL]|uniref:Uncharacterized protein n=1 Tax=Microcystis aeruginosa PCC 7806SL TaxID=1903187 RepID=A0AB33BVC3_MICA7|nr:hypothetical protein BH695_4470 [Microcystis aeruginosa PCC 7806SL]